MSGRSNTHFSVAVHVLVYLAGTGEVVSSDDLAVSANVNPVYVRRVLGPLREAGIVASKSGAHGGWFLGRRADRIRLDEVWSLVTGEDAVVATHGPDPNCPVGRQVTVLMDEIEAGISAAVRRELHGRTVARLVAEATRGSAVDADI